uniref:Proprotein convertase subtilisin/kexin type 5-like isoform X2 n=1 Tax=Crassostrea virginica TaxID=6565 RepID=A0A8B8BPK2_CRAVI|nr:proprotein convertase subtilisin/kexin type 5-like isoform X2 [Crassostrea virginica]
MSGLCVCLGTFLFSISFAYDNIALRNPAYQENRYTGLSEALSQASNAVDGLKTDLSVWGGQCVISGNNKKTATWWVNLTSILSIHHMRIYYRTGNAPWGPTNGFTPRFLGFSVYVSNTTDKSEGSLCFKDTSYTVNTIPPVINITCPMHGQYVIYYNERLSWTSFPSDEYRYAHNDLCEFEIYGCRIPGVYGTNCSMPCPDNNCRYCHIETGACQGCKPGYQGHRCELECNDGKYGEVCGEECGFCADLSYCNHVNGTCLSGCDAGYKGNLCRHECDLGTYGDKCNETCGNCQDLNECHHSNGTCLTGCRAGYDGALCKTPCPDGLFGPGCVDKCNITCRGCNRVSGLCQNGCLPGWKGDYCHIECDFGTYGDMCNETCGKCLDQTHCHHTNGTCLSGCSAGYDGALCKTYCDDNFFGENCKERCNETCIGCNRKTGVCEYGCRPGWKGIYCHEACDAGYYGKRCLQECSAFCKISRDCHHVTGYCTYGCKSGWQGKDCLEVSKLLDSSTDKQSFYVALSLFCGSLLLNGFFVAYIIILRKSKGRGSKKFQPDLTTANTIVEENYKNGSDVNGEYQELGEIGKDNSTYEALQ